MLRSFFYLTTELCSAGSRTSFHEAIETDFDILNSDFSMPMFKAPQK